MDKGGLDSKNVDKCLTKCLNKEKDTTIQRWNNLQSCVGEAENKRFRCEKKLEGHRRELAGRTIMH